jgi:hypothetical protein
MMLGERGIDELGQRDDLVSFKLPQIKHFGIEHFASRLEFHLGAVMHRRLLVVDEEREDRLLVHIIGVEQVCERGVDSSAPFASIAMPLACFDPFIENVAFPSKKRTMASTSPLLRAA